MGVEPVFRRQKDPEDQNVEQCSSVLLEQAHGSKHDMQGNQIQEKFLDYPYANTRSKLREKHHAFMESTPKRSTMHGHGAFVLLEQWDHYGYVTKIHYLSVIILLLNSYHPTWPPSCQLLLCLCAISSLVSTDKVTSCFDVNSICIISPKCRCIGLCKCLFLNKVSKL